MKIWNSYGSEHSANLVLIGRFSEVETAKNVESIIDEISAHVSQSPERPAGILILGRELQSGRSIDDLAKTIKIAAKPVPSMDALLSALNSAAQRNHCRLPLVIDVLNEAQDPREWKQQLSRLELLLQKFPHVLVVCTLRNGSQQPAEEKNEWLGRPQESEERDGFVKDAIPDDVECLKMEGFGEDETAAIEKYFNHYRIVAGDADLPLELLHHPLTLRIFCEVTNPKRQNPVGIEGMPGSLAALFERYVNAAIDRIGELAPRHQRYFPQDVRKALDDMGIMLWESKKRYLPESDLRSAVGDSHRPWNESLIQMLEQKGIILRMRSSAGGINVVPVYDAMGGYG